MRSRTRIRLGIAAGLACSVLRVAAAQSPAADPAPVPPLRFEHLSTEQGLSYVTEIVQGQDQVRRVDRPSAS